MDNSRIFETQDGSHSIVSKEFGESYHSKYGAIQESLHVFIQAGLHAKARETKSLDILEIGWGSGLNAYLTLLEAQQRELSVRYTGVEAYPISTEEAAKLNYPQVLKSDPQLSESFYKMHQLPWELPHQISPKFTFTKTQKRFEELDFDAVFDVVYFDAFAPNAQPELWEEPVLKIMYNALKNNGILVTYCAKGSVKRVLKNLGFTVEALPGPPGKREMTRAVKKSEF